MANGRLDASAFFRWAAGALLGVVLLGVGGFAGELRASSRYEDFDDKIGEVAAAEAAHEASLGHPVMVERISRLEAAMIDRFDRLERILEGGT